MRRPLLQLTLGCGIVGGSSRTHKSSAGVSNSNSGVAGTTAHAPAPAPTAGAAAGAGSGITPESLGLTGRQLDVLWLLLEGMSNKQICRKLDLAEATVKVHVRAILRALNVDSRTEAVVVATRMGLVPPAGAVAAGSHG